MSEELIAGLTHGQLEQLAMDVKRFNDMYRWHGRPAMYDLKSYFAENIREYLEDDKEDFSKEYRQEKLKLLNILDDLERCFSSRPTLSGMYFYLNGTKADVTGS